MPSYDFRCRECGHDFELHLSMSAYADGDGRVCPKCHTDDVERRWTAANVITSRAGSSGSQSGCGSGGFT